MISRMSVWKKSRKRIMEEMLLALWCPPFIGSSSFLQVTRTTIKAWMSSNFGWIQSLTAELAALECLTN